MTPLEHNKAAVRHFWEEQERGSDAAYERMDAAVVVHMAGGPDVTGRDGQKHLAAMFFGAFPDMHHTTEHQIAEGDWVVTRFTATGTHQGEFMGVPPSGRRIQVTGVLIDRFAAGRIAERWVQFDAMGLMQQIGAIPSP